MNYKRVMGIILVFVLSFVSVLSSFPDRVFAASKTKLNKREISMTVGTSYTLKVRNLPKKANIKWTSSIKKRMTVSRKGVVHAKKPGMVTICSQIEYKGKHGKKKINLDCRIKIEKAPKVPDGAIPISIEAGNVVLDGVLYDNPTAKEFAKRLPMTAELWHPANFARVFDLKKEIPDIEPHTREYELGGIAYWYDGSSVAIFYRHTRKKTVVPVVTIRKVTSDVSVFRKYGGKIRIWKKYH